MFYPSFTSSKISKVSLKNITNFSVSFGSSAKTKCFETSTHSGHAVCGWTEIPRLTNCVTSFHSFPLIISRQFDLRNWRIQLNEFCFFVVEKPLKFNFYAFVVIRNVLTNLQKCEVSKFYPRKCFVDESKNNKMMKTRDRDHKKILIIEMLSHHNQSSRSELSTYRLTKRTKIKQIRCC